MGDHGHQHSKGHPVYRSGEAEEKSPDLPFFGDDGQYEREDIPMEGNPAGVQLLRMLPRHPCEPAAHPLLQGEGGRAGQRGAHPVKQDRREGTEKSIHE